MRKILFFLLIILSSSMFASTPSLSITIEPDVIGINDTAVITIESSQKLDKINAPKSSDFELAFSGEGQSSQVSIINGKITTSTTYTYSYTLKPKKRGVLQIPPFEILAGKQSYSTKALTIKIVKESVRKNTQNPFSLMEEFFEPSTKIPKIMLELVPSQSICYQNQQLILDIFLVATAKEAFDYQYTENFPARSDKADLIDISKFVKDSSIVSRGNEYYHLYKRFVIYPIQDGTNAVTPPSIIAISPYGQFQIQGNAVGIIAKKINKESGISYIGNLNISYSLPSNNISSGTGTELTIKMEGDGNLKTLSNPYSSLKIPGLFISSPTSQLKFKSYSSGKAFFEQEIKYTLMPRKAGVFKIPSLSIRYYDSELHPKEINIPEFTITATSSSVAKKDKDFNLMYIENPENTTYVFTSPFSIALPFIFIIIPFLSFFYGRHLEKIKTDKEYARNFLASKRLSKYLLEAKKNLEKREFNLFYSSLQKGLFYFLTDKLHLPQSIGYKEILNELRARNYNPEWIKKFEIIYTLCISGAYSKGGNKSNPESILQDAQTLVEKFH